MLHSGHAADRPPLNQRAYRAEVTRLLAFVGLATVSLGDVQTFSDSLAGQATSSRTRRLAAVKSLLAFAAHRLPTDRFLTEPDVHRMLALEQETSGEIGRDNEFHNRGPSCRQISVSR